MVLYHAVARIVPSGLVGVDIFFVISGYLICGIIYRESVAGHFTYSSFYARRARRILPALTIVIVSVIAAGFFILDTQELMLLVGSAQWALLGISNIFFLRNIDYFANDASLNPLLMTWSLAVEEQFYIIFPLFLLIFKRSRLRVVLLVLGAICLASFLFSVYSAIFFPLVGFYLLPARIWELGAGCLLSIVHAHIKPDQRWGANSNFLAAVGLVGMVSSFWLYGDHTPFPGWAALLPVIGACAVLHTSDSLINRKFLTASVFVRIGLVSYSWYLWHWPLMALIKIATAGSATALSMLGMAIISLVLAYGSWSLIEKPLRRRILPDSRVLVRYATGLVGCLLMLAWIKHERTFDTLRLSPKALYVERSGDIENRKQTCMLSFGESALRAGVPCTPPNASFALFGDSHAAALAPGLRAYVIAHGSSLTELTKASCPPLLGYSRLNDLSPNNLIECANFQKLAVDKIGQNPLIKTVVLAGYLDNPGSDVSFKIKGNGFVRVGATQALQEGTKTLVDELVKAKKSVIIVIDSPKYDKNIHSFLMTKYIPLRDILNRRMSSSWLPHSDIEQTQQMRLALRQSVKGIAGVKIIDLVDQFCVHGICRIANGLHPLYIDGQHLSQYGSMSVDWRAVNLPPVR